MGQEQSSEQNPNKSTERSPAGSIVVVKSGKITSKDQQIMKDPDIVKLNNIMAFYPLMKSTLNNTPGNSTCDFEVTNRLDPRPARALCGRYERHLKLCAQAVAFDQDAISRRVREMESHSLTVLRVVSERHKKLHSQMLFISTVEDVKRNIDRVEITLQQIIPMMEKLNEMLPKADRMEPFLKM